MDKDDMTVDRDETAPRDGNTAGSRESADTTVSAALPGLPLVDAKEPAAPDAGAAKAEPPASEPESLAEKRTRLVTAGLATAVILSVIAVLVAGVFQLTSIWLFASQEQHSANGPTPLLWNQLVSERVQAQPLGVPRDVAVQVGLKETVVPQDESASEPARTQ
jgi:hypothetical protein